MSVLEKAQQLAARARTYSEGAKEREERTRINTALNEVDRLLTELTATADAYVAARAAGVPVTALKTPGDLVNMPSGGLPGFRAFVPAKQRVTGLTSSARDAVNAAWRNWAQTEIDTANLGRISRLGIQHRRQAADVRKRLQVTVNRQVTAAEIKKFCQDLAELERLLADISEDDPLVLLLDRIRKGRTTLADLTDEEIASLRVDRSVAAQVFLQTS